MERIHTGKKTVPVTFQKYPDEVIEQTEIFLNFYENSQKQASFAGKKIPKIEDLEKQGVLEAITFHYTKIGEEPNPISIPRIVEGKSLCLYAKIKGISTLVPLEYHEQVDHVITRQEIVESVHVEAEQFYDRYVITATATSICVLIGTGVEINMPNASCNKKHSVKIKFKIAGTLKQRVQAMSFIGAIRRVGRFSIGNKNFDLDLSKQNQDDVRVNEWNKVLADYKLISSMFDKLNIPKDLDFDGLFDEDVRKLNILVNAIQFQRTVHGLSMDVDPPALINYKIGNICILLFVSQEENGGIRLFDFFEYEIPTWVNGEDGVAYSVSQFSGLREEDFLTADNLRLDRVVDSFIKTGSNEAAITCANNTLLEMLKAYDKSGNNDLLATCKKLGEWLYDLGDKFSKEVSTINLLQIIARQRKLKYGEKQQLNNIISITDDEVAKICAFILLDEQEEAQKLIGALDEHRLLQFEKFPICHFLK